MAGTVQVQTADRKLYEKAIECPCGMVVLISAETPNLAALSLEQGGANVIHGDHIRAHQAELALVAAQVQVRMAQEQARTYARAGRRADARVAQARAREAEQLLRAHTARRRGLSLRERRKGR